MLRRPGVHAVHSVHRFVLSVPDLAEAEHFYRHFGLAVSREGDRLDLRTEGSGHVGASVFVGPGPKRLAYVSFAIDAADQAAMAERIARLGLACPPHPKSDGSGLWLHNPDGTPLQLVVAPKVSPSEKARPSPTPVVPLGQGAAPSRSRTATVRPRCLSHVLFFTPDVSRMVNFCTEVPGLRLSDRSGEGIAFMHGAHGSDHHLARPRAWAWRVNPGSG